MAAVSELQIPNARLLQTALETRAALEACRRELAAAAADPANDHAANTSAIEAMQHEAAAQIAVLHQEIELRRKLDGALRAHDTAAASDAWAALKTHRRANGGRYGAALTLPVAEPCKGLRRLKPVQRPDSADAAADLITGVFEAGKPPDYCAIADSSGDAGGLSYGKHQAAERRGGLYRMLDRYVHATDPAPDPRAKAEIRTHLRKFNRTRNRYDGSAADRAAFKRTLKEACSDPAMRKVQDDFFAADYLEPARAAAAKLCVRSPLGLAMLYDIAVQSGPARIAGPLRKGEPLAARAMKRLKTPKASRVRPCDPDGPTEAEFLQALNDERRAFLESLPGDAAKSTYRSDFFDGVLKAGDLGLDRDFVVRGVPVKGLAKGA